MKNKLILVLGVVSLFIVAGTSYSYAAGQNAHKLLTKEKIIRPISKVDYKEEIKKTEKTQKIIAETNNKDYVWPTDARTITQYFGLNHKGVDIAGPLNTSVYAVLSGKIEKADCEFNRGYGCFILIDHGNNIKTSYAHNSKNLVSVGEEVKTGQEIAKMGNTGKVYGSSGTHLHFELIVNGIRKNPLNYIK